MRISPAGLGLVLLSAACFGSGGPATKAAFAAGLTPMQVVQARVAITALTLVAVLAVHRPAALRVRRAEWPLLLAYGVLAFFAVQACYALALSRLPVGLALLLEYLAPVLVALWVRLVRRQVLPRATWLGAALAVCGLAMVARVWQGFRLDGLGAAYGLSAAAGLAAYFLLSERGLAGDRDPIGLVAWGALIGTVPLALTTSPLRFPYAALGTAVPLGSWSPPVWLPLLWLGLVSTVAAYLTGVAVLRLLPSQVASVLATIEVLIAAGELGGVIIVQLRPPARHTPPAVP